MDLSAPTRDVVPGVRGALLEALARIEQPVTRRELAVVAGVAPGHASGVVAEWIAAGLVHEQTAGRASLVWLNRDHLAAAPVLALAGLRGELVQRLRGRLGTWPGVAAAWLFGSVARGDAGSSSDVDLLVVVDDPDDEAFHDLVAALDADVLAWTGNELQVVEHTPATWRALVRERNPLVDQIRTDGIALTDDTAGALARSR